MANLTWDKIFEKIVTALGLAQKAAERARGPVGSLADDIEALGDSAEATGKSTNPLIAAMSKFKDVVVAADKTVGLITKKTLDWQTAARTAARGTVLLSNSAATMQRNYLVATKSALAYASATGANVNDALQMGVALETTYSRAARRVRDLGNSQKYLDQASQYQIMLGMNTADTSRFMQMTVEDMNLTFKQSADIMGGAAASAALFGTSANSSMVALAEHMDRIQSLDQADRVEYSKKLLHAAGVQDTASVRFGKYTDSLTSSQGTSAITKAAFLSATTGIRTGDLLKAINNPQDASQQQLLMRAIEQSGEKIAPGFAQLDRLMKSHPERLTDEQAMRHSIDQQKIIATLGKYGITPEMMAQLSGKTGARARAQTAAGYDVYKAEADKKREGVANILLTQSDKDAALEAKKAKLLGVGTVGQDNMLDVWGNYERYIKRTGLELLELTQSAIVLGRAFMALTGITSLQGLTGLLGPGGALAGMAGKINAVGGKVGLAAIAVEAALAINKVSTEEGRAQMRSEIDSAVENTESLSGNIANFGKAFISPTESILKVGIMAKDAWGYWNEVHEEQERAKRHKERMDAEVAANRKKAGESADGAALLKAASRSQQFLDIFAHGKGEGKNYHNKAEMATILAMAIKAGKTEGDALSEIRDRNARFSEALKTGDETAKKAIDAEFKALRDIRNKVYFEGGSLPALPTVEKGTANAPVTVSMIPPKENTVAQQQANNTVGVGEMREAMGMFSNIEHLLREIASSSTSRTIIPA